MHQNKMKYMIYMINLTIFMLKHTQIMSYMTKMWKYQSLQAGGHWFKPNIAQ